MSFVDFLYAHFAEIILLCVLLMNGIYTLFWTKRLILLYQQKKDLENLMGVFKRELSLGQTQLQHLMQCRKQLDSESRKDIETLKTLISELRFFTHCGEGVLSRLDTTLSLSRNAVREGKRSTEEPSFVSYVA